MSEYPCSFGVNAPLAVRYARTNALLLILARRKKTTFLFVDDTWSCVRETLLASLSMITSILSFAILLLFLFFLFVTLFFDLDYYVFGYGRIVTRDVFERSLSRVLLCFRRKDGQRQRRGNNEKTAWQFPRCVASETNKSAVGTFRNYKNILNAVNSPRFASFVGTCV